MLSAISRVHEETSSKLLDIIARVSNMTTLNSQLEKKINQLLQSLDQGDLSSIKMSTSHTEVPVSAKESLT